MKAPAAAVLGLALVLPVLFFAAPLQAKDEPVTVRGTVVEDDWDDDDNVIAVAISSDEEYYVVDKRGKGKDLLKLVDKEVEVKGTVKEDEDGNRIITVRSYQVLE
jgi:hypothetical protein